MTEATGNESSKEGAEPLGTPWETKWNDAVVKPMEKAVETVKQAVGGPWERMWGASTPAPQKAPVAPPDRFETVFNKLITQESGGKHTDASGKLTTSSVGAQGITQLMPKTTKDPGYGVEPLKNKTEGEYIRFGKDYLRAMLSEFGGDYRQALAAYNAGPGVVKKAVEKHGSNWLSKMPDETKKYVEKVMR